VFGGALVGSLLPPNGSRLSRGRNARGRKELERQNKRLAGEATQLFLTYWAPGSFKRLLGGGMNGDAYLAARHTIKQTNSIHRAPAIRMPAVVRGTVTPSAWNLE